MTVSDTTSRLNDWVVEPLLPHHGREAFNCGLESLNMFLRQQAGQNAKKDFSRTFVAIPEAGSPDTIGYYTLAMSSFSFDELPKEKHLPRYPVPIAHLGRLAVNLRHRGRHIGEYLLFHALLRVQMLSEEIGVFAVEVRALDEAVSRFYARYGCTPLGDDLLYLYLTLKSIRTLGLR
jgi:ribosomal protein S18 acetylase RimI-like enzyme